MNEFFPLTVNRIDRLTDDAVAISFDLRNQPSDRFSFEPGQHVTVRAIIDGNDVRRSYSVCSEPGNGTLQVGIKQLDGGVFSTWANTALAEGMTLDVMPPVGDFTIPPDSLHVGAIAAGSGITPIMSMVRTHLGSNSLATFTLIFGNRTAQSIMFLEELEGLKNRHPDRLQVVHILTGEPANIPLFSGRIDATKIHELLDTVATGAVDDWFLCGPYEMVHEARAALSERGHERVHDELFFSEPFVAPPPPPASTEGFAEVTFTLDGRASLVAVDPTGEPILDYALGVRSELPFSCRGGVCATCKAQLVSGTVDMKENWCLVPDEIEAGLILTCQAHPTSATVEIDYDV